jgi:hypothetical protein
LRNDGNNYGSNSNVRINFNRFIANSPYAIQVVGNYAGTLNAEHNWWGCNYGPGSTGAGCAAPTNPNSGAAIDAVPWIMLQLASARPTVGQNNKVAVTAYMSGTSAGADVANLGSIPDMIPAAFSSTAGTIVPAASYIVGGKAPATFNAGSALVTATITTTVDGQTVSIPLPIVPNTIYLPIVLRD